MAKKRGRKKKTGPKGPSKAKQIEQELDKRERQGYSMLAKCQYENVKEHRAFLLWAMQTPPSKAKVGKIFDVTGAGVAYWANRYHWERRRKESKTVALECQSLYRSLYYSTMGESEVKQLGMWLETPVTAVPVNQDIVDKVRDIVKQSPVDPKTEREKKLRTRHLSAIDAAIAYLMQGIKDGSIRRNLRDLPMLIQLREQMGGDKKGEVTQLVVESLRVQQAKSNDGNVIEAMYEDALELMSVLKNLKSTGEGYEAIHGKVEEEV